MLNQAKFGVSPYAVRTSPTDRTDVRSVRALIEMWTAVGYSPETISQRLSRLDALGVDPADANRGDVLASLPPDLKPSSRRVYLSALSACFRDLVTLGLRTDNPAVGLRVPGFHSGLPRPLPPDVLAAMVAERGPERDWTVLGAYAGLRAGDVAGLAREDLTDHGQGPVLVVTGKGGVVGAIPVHPLVAEIIEPRRPGLMWRVSSGAVSNQWSQWGLALTGQRFRFHQCRHTFATRVYQASGQDLLVTRDLMRHRSVATTQVYAQADQSRGFVAVSSL